MSLVLSGDDGASKVNIEAFNSEGAAPQYVARAWVAFNGSGPAIYESGNVSSITDEGVGDYTVNFTTNMPDINYAAVRGGQGAFTNSYKGPSVSNATPTVSGVRVANRNTSGTAQDVTWEAVVIFR